MAIISIAAMACNSSKQIIGEPHRPAIHFTPAEKWMNDPNGMVFYNNTYHLFYQYYPDSTIWGPMHWGHATSTDLVKWNHEPVALYPDSLGYIFSGSAVVDSNNTSGLAKNGEIPLVAIFTHHDPAGEKSGRNDYQYQSIAYSLDAGKSWTKYSGNPVLANPGIKDFRDPKVSWHEDTKKWIMTLATLDRITFYSSDNLLNWTRESEFGKDLGAHGGVWECPDLFPLDLNGEKVWILIVSINPGGPNGGSATQYFTGNFDGKTFTPFHTDIQWIDFGPDNYAGVTWANTGKRKIFMGWMNNWQYANLVPTEKWRGATTLPRDLSLQKIDGKYFIASTISPELDRYATNQTTELGEIKEEGKKTNFNSLVRVSLNSSRLDSYQVILSNDKAQKLIIGFEKSSNRYFIDRSASGKIDFEKGFGVRHYAPRISKKETSSITLFIDRASVELFADEGLSVMTSTFFPDEDFTSIEIAPVNMSFEKTIITHFKPAE